MASLVFSRVLRWFLIVSYVGFWFSLHPTRSYACSCAGPGSPSEELENASAVFKGEAVSVREFPGIFGIRGSMDPTTVKFRVKAVWKGADSQTRYVTTARSEASCGFSFVEGTDYVVYSHNGLDVSLCSRTRPLSEAPSDLATFGQGITPAVGTIAQMSFVVAFLAGLRGGLSLALLILASYFEEFTLALLILVLMIIGVPWIVLRDRRKRRSRAL